MGNKPARPFERLCTTSRWTRKRRKILNKLSKELHRILQSVGTERGVQGFNGSKTTIFDKEAHLRTLMGIPPEVDVYETLLTMKKRQYSFTPEGYLEYFTAEEILPLKEEEEKVAA